MNILVAGGTGTIGRAVCEELIAHGIGNVYVLSRDDSKQAAMRIDVPQAIYRIGDITHVEDCMEVCEDVRAQLVVNCAALKHVDACEQNPTFAQRVNHKAAKVFYRYCRKNGAARFLQVSTDKAVEPMSVLGTTKMMAERDLLKRPGVVVVRFGNVIGSRGSILDVAHRQIAQTGALWVTSEKMMRYWIDVQSAAKFIVDVLLNGEPHRVHVPQMQERLLVDVLQEKYPGIPVKITHPALGEKIREKLWWDYEDPKTGVHCCPKEDGGTSRCRVR